MFSSFQLELTRLCEMAWNDNLCICGANYVYSDKRTRSTSALPSIARHICLVPHRDALPEARRRCNLVLMLADGPVPVFQVLYSQALIGRNVQWAPLCVSDTNTWGGLVSRLPCINKQSAATSIGKFLTQRARTLSACFASGYWAGKIMKDQNSACLFYW